MIMVAVLAGGRGSEHENCGRARLRNQFLYDSSGFSCMILYTSMHTSPVTCDTHAHGHFVSSFDANKPSHLDHEWIIRAAIRELIRATVATVDETNDTMRQYSRRRTTNINLIFNTGKETVSNRTRYFAIKQYCMHDSF